MDLETIEDKLLERDFKNKAEFIKAINLMLLNCLKYNGIYSGKCQVNVITKTSNVETLNTLNCLPSV